LYIIYQATKNAFQRWGSSSVERQCCEHPVVSSLVTKSSKKHPPSILMIQNVF